MLPMIPSLGSMAKANLRTSQQRSRVTALSSLLLLLSLTTLSAGHAQSVCKVTDPTGTPLNVRDKPNGRIVNALLNGREVTIHEGTYDEQGKPWVLVGGTYRGDYRVWGWVTREFISCYKQ